MPGPERDELFQAERLFLAGAYEKATEACLEVIAVSDSARARLLLGEIMEARGQDSAAMQEYRRALDLEPGNSRAEERIGRLSLKRSSALLQSGLPSERHPLKALLLSFFLPGLGQLYNRRGLKGLSILALHVVLFSNLLLQVLSAAVKAGRGAGGSLPGTWYLLLTAEILLWTFSLYDAWADFGPPDE